MEFEHVGKGGPDRGCSLWNGDNRSDVARIWDVDGSEEGEQNTRS